MVSVPQSGTGIALRADDGSGHIGISNLFGVVMPPTMTTLAATAVTGTSATLNGTVNANGDNSAVSFNYGTSASYGTTITAIPSPVTGNGATAVSAVLTGLTPGATYHYRVTGANGGGTSTGADLTFTTPSNSNADLADLVLGSGSLTPVFASATTSYTASVSNATGTLTVTPTVADSFATVKVNGVAVASGTAAAIQPTVGLNTITTVVTAQNGLTQKTYTLALTRRTPYQDWAAGLGLGEAAMNPEGDLDGDGLKNLLEWAFALDPSAASATTLQVLGGVITSHGIPVMAGGPGGSARFALFGRRKDAAAVGVTYAVVAIPFPALVNGRPPAFFRLKVSEP
jgi:hypothetical protein